MYVDGCRIFFAIVCSSLIRLVGYMCLDMICWSKIVGMQTEVCGCESIVEGWARYVLE